jgi:predicted nucleic acid-binding protein
MFENFLETVPIFAIDDSVIKNNGKLISNNMKHYKDIKKLELINWLE